MKALRVSAGVAIRLAAVLVLLTILPLVWPTTETPARADAIVVLSGDYGDRMAEALSLVKGGVASTLVFVGTPDSAAEYELCRGGQPFEVVCLRPQPDSTRAEAQATARLARERGWENIAVVTSNYHVSRARMLFRRCYDGRLTMVGTTPPYDENRRLPTEWLKLSYTLFVTRGC